MRISRRLFAGRPLSGTTPIRLVALCALAATSLVVAACDDEDSGPAPYEAAEGCNPIGGSVDCLFPFPSDVFRGEEGVVFTEAAIPASGSSSIDYASVTGTLDGYSVATPIFVLFPEPLSFDPLLFHTEDLSPTTSLSEEATTMVVNAETGMGVRHFAELDERVSETTARTLQIRLLENLEPGQRYIVAVRGMENLEGQLVEPLEGFDALRSGNVSAELEALSAHIRDNVLAPLADEGIDTDALQVAWDFTTRSNDSARSDVLSMIEQTREWLATNDPVLTNVEVREGEDLTDEEAPDLQRVVEATLSVPLFLASDQPGAAMTRDESGEPVSESVAEVPILILIPQSIEGGDDVPVIQFGHGFFGSTDEMTDSFFDEFIDEYGYIGVGTNWWGLSDADLGSVADAIIGNPSNTFLIVDRLKQSFVNHYVLSSYVRTELADAAFMADPDAEGTAYTSGSNLAFYGISLGHILGSSMVSVSDQLTRAVFSVGGGPLTFAMSRAAPFSTLVGLLSSQLGTPVDIQKFVALSSLQLEAVDPMAWADQLVVNDLGDEPFEREILAQIGIGDSFVPWLASEMWRAATGLSIGTPTPFELLPFNAIALPTEDDAVVYFDFGLEDPLPGTFSEIPPSDATVHSGVRESSAGQEQVDIFIRTGEIVDTCDGLCDPE